MSPFFFPLLQDSTLHPRIKNRFLLWKRFNPLIAPTTPTRPRNNALLRRIFVGIGWDTFMSRKSWEGLSAIHRFFERGESPKTRLLESNWKFFFPFSSELFKKFGTRVCNSWKTFCAGSNSTFVI